MSYTSFPADAVVSGTPVSTTKFGNITKANLDDHESRLATVETRTTDASTGNTQLGTRVTAVESALPGKVATTRTITAGTGLTGGGDLSANRSFAVSYGTAAGTAVQGNDTRVTITQDATKGNNALDSRVSTLEAATSTAAQIVRYYASGGQAITGSTNTPIQFDTVDQANTSLMTVSGTGNTTFTCVKAGWYHIAASARVGSNLEISIKKNGNNTTNAEALDQGALNASCSAKVKLAVGDTILVNAWCSATTNIAGSWGKATQVSFEYRGT